MTKKNKKKILLFHHYGGMGGAGLSFLHIVKSIDKNKYEVVVVCPMIPDDMYIEINNIDKVTVIATEKEPVIFPHYNGGSWSIINPIFIKKIISYTRNKDKIKRIISEQKPDIIITNSMTTSYINKIASKEGIRNICFVRETYAKGIFGVRTKLIKKNLEYANKVVFISNYDMYKSKSVKSDKLVIYDKVEKEKYDFSSNVDKCSADIIDLDKSGKKYILFLGGISKLKGINVLIKSFVKIKEDVDLIILGGKINENWSLRKRLLYYKIIRKLKKHDRIDNVHFKETTSLPEKYYKISDIIVFPSTKAHQARPIYEAGFSRKPIIITEFKETKEFTINNYNVLTFKKNSSKDLTEKISLILNDDKITKHIIRYNYLLSIEKHDFNKLKEEINTLIIDLLE